MKSSWTTAVSTARRDFSPWRRGRPSAKSKSAPSFFGADGLTVVVQHFAKSDDGTAVPYFVVPKRRCGGPAPTLLGGYGGFQVSAHPPTTASWDGSGCPAAAPYVMANIRGGGEYGPGWHTQSQRAGPKCFEDFAAVARDLVARGIFHRGCWVRGAAAMEACSWGDADPLSRTVDRSTGVPGTPAGYEALPPIAGGRSWIAEYGKTRRIPPVFFVEIFSRTRTFRLTAYPPVLITTSTRDDRVHPGHAEDGRRSRGIAGSRSGTTRTSKAGMPARPTTRRPRSSAPWCSRFCAGPSG